MMIDSQNQNELIWDIAEERLADVKKCMEEIVQHYIPRRVRLQYNYFI